MQVVEENKPDPFKQLESIQQPMAQPELTAQSAPTVPIGQQTEPLVQSPIEKPKSPWGEPEPIKKKSKVGIAMKILVFIYLLTSSMYVYLSGSAFSTFVEAQWPLYAVGSLHLIMVIVYMLTWRSE